MTMKRHTKAEALTGYAARRAGTLVESSPSPRLIARHGRFLPAEVAAPLFLSFERTTSTRDRRSWSIARIRFAEPTRDRVAHLPTAYIPRHAR